MASTKPDTRKPIPSLLDQTKPSTASVVPVPNVPKKSNQTIRFEHDNVGRTLTWYFEKLAGVPTVEYSYRRMFDSETPCDYACFVHGVKQKIGDGAAKSADPKSGRSADQVKLDTCAAIAKSLAAGVFNRIGGGAAGPSLATVSDLVDAICMARKKTDKAALRAMVDTWSPESRANMQSKPDIATALLTIYRQRMPAGAVDAAEAGLDDVA